MLTDDKVRQIVSDALDEYREVIVDLIILGSDERSIWAQKRSENRKLFPGVWEFPGGLIRTAKDVRGQIDRLLQQECEMELKHIIDLVHLFQWDEDRGVVTIQFLVKAKGEYKPDFANVSAAKLIGPESTNLLLVGKKETPISRGAYYAIMRVENADLFFTQITFFDTLLTRFFRHMNIQASTPRIAVHEERKFRIDIEKSFVLLPVDSVVGSPDFLLANLILHQVLHNYCEQITEYEDIKQIRFSFGYVFSLYIDIVADVHTYLFFKKYYAFTPEDYMSLCWKQIEQYTGKTIETSKATRLIGTLLTISSVQTGGAIHVILPVFSSSNSNMHVLAIDGRALYSCVKLPNKVHKEILETFTRRATKLQSFTHIVHEIMSAYNKG